MNQKTRNILTAVLNAALALKASEQVQLLPAGAFSGRDGRPGKGKSWTLTDAQGQALATKLNVRHGAGNAEFNFDYEHQSILTAKNGQPAPASGWASQFEWRNGAGLFTTNARWTERAKNTIESAEYKYISPVIAFDSDTGEVLDVLNAALTNFPNLMQMSSVAQAVAQLNADYFSNTNPPEKTMTLLAALMALMNLPASTTDAQAIDAVKVLQAKADKPPKAVLPAALSAALGLATDANETAALSAVTALKEGAATLGIDAVSVQVVKALQGQVAALSAQINTADLNKMVDEAMKVGKLLPAQKDWAVKLGQSDLAQLSAFLKDAPVVAAGLGSTQTGGKEGGADELAALTAEELSVCTTMGIAPKDFKAAAVAA